MKKFLIRVVLVFCLFLSQYAFAQNLYIPHENEVIFNQASIKIDTIDPQVTTNLKGINYPGLRGSNQLVIYTPSFGYRTNTNEFGTEAIIENNTVTSLSGADSLIPVNGFVISGHGKAKKWINENILVGAKVFLDTENKIVTSYITSDTFLYSAREKMKEVQNMMLYYAQNVPDYNQRKVEQYLYRANDLISKAQKYKDDSQKYVKKANEYIDMAMAIVIPYNENELKGVWVRPLYFNKQDIVGVLDSLASCGVNNIFIETYYHGQTIFPSKTMKAYNFIEQNPDYVGIDPLKIWIEEAHKRGIKVHIWFETFYVGNKSPQTNPNYILAQKPEWANYQKKNADSCTLVYSVSEHNGYFIDPANPQVQNFLYTLITEIVNNYHPDGINLDYIRYPQSLASTYPTYDMSTWGYTQYARNDFKNIYGVDPIELKPSDTLWFQWKYYRCNKVTNFVRKVSTLCRYNNIAITTVIFPNRLAALDTKFQDWRNWSINNFVDGFTPLFLTCDDKTTSNLIEEVLRNKASSTQVFAGLFTTFMNGSHSDLIKQIHVERKYGLSGIILFDYAHFTENYKNLLKESVFKPLSCAKTVQREK